MEIGSISCQHDDQRGLENWHWGVDVMPLMDHGGTPPTGTAPTFMEALVAFKAAFLDWRRQPPSGLWQANLEYKRTGQERRL